MLTVEMTKNLTGRVHVLSGYILDHSNCPWQTLLKERADSTKDGEI